MIILAPPTLYAQKMKGVYRIVDLCQTILYQSQVYSTCLFQTLCNFTNIVLIKKGVLTYRLNHTFWTFKHIYIQKFRHFRTRGL